jgi:hypothetical protein
VKEPLNPSAAKKLVVAILKDGVLAFSGHAYKEMGNDSMIENDVINTLRAGSYRPGEFENGSWRYRAETAHFAAVVAFRTEKHCVVVTAFKLKIRR